MKSDSKLISIFSLLTLVTCFLSFQLFPTFCLSSDSEETQRTLDRPLLVALKTLPGVNERGSVVQGRPFEVRYLLKNVGSEPALDVLVTDLFPTESFTFVSINGVNAARDSGPTFHHSWAKLSPGQNVTVSLVLVPENSGTLDTIRAEIEYKYRASDDPEAEPTLVTSASTTPGRIEITKPENYERNRALTVPSTHTFTWVAIFIASLSLVSVPYTLYSRTK